MEQMPKIEELDIKIEIASEKDWEDYKKLRILELTEDGKEMHDSNETKIDSLHKMTEEDWKAELSRKDMFAVIAKNGHDSVGVGNAEEDARGFWVLGNGHVLKEFRNYGIGKKLFSERLNEIKNRGGKKILLAVKNNNAPLIHIAESFGFKKINKIEQSKFIKNPKSLITEQIMGLGV